MSEKLESHLCHLLPCTAIWASVVVGEGGAVVTSGQCVRRVWESSSPSNRAGQGRHGECLRRSERPVGAHVLVCLSMRPPEPALLAPHLGLCVVRWVTVIHHKCSSA